MPEWCSARHVQCPTCAVPDMNDARAERSPKSAMPERCSGRWEQTTKAKADQRQRQIMIQRGRAENDIRAIIWRDGSNGNVLFMTSSPTFRKVSHPDRLLSLQAFITLLPRTIIRTGAPTESLNTPIIQSPLRYRLADVHFEDVAIVCSSKARGLIRTGQLHPIRHRSGERVSKTVAMHIVTDFISRHWYRL
jgi:hypothetical protein